jgi:hypothetical protein
MYGPPSDCKEKARSEKTSLRKCIRPLVEHSAPGQDELRAYLSLLVGRSSSTNSSSRFQARRCDCSFVLAVLIQTSVGNFNAVKWERVSASTETMKNSVCDGPAA